LQHKYISDKAKRAKKESQLEKIASSTYITRNSVTSPVVKFAHSTPAQEHTFATSGTFQSAGRSWMALQVLAASYRRQKDVRCKVRKHMKPKKRLPVSAN
jgi:uncharacterized protein YpbB